MPKSHLLSRRVYRALLRSAKPFTEPSPEAAVLSSLLYRSHSPLVDKALDRDTTTKDGNNDENREKNVRKLFSRLLRDVFAVDSGLGMEKSTTATASMSTSSAHVPLMRFPSHCQAQPTKLRDVIRREFRVPSVQQVTSTTGPTSTDKGKTSISATFDISVREKVAFLALRKLNEKLCWADDLAKRQPLSITPCPQQAALHVSPLFRSNPPSPLSRMELINSLQAGTFLIAHPLMTGYFHRTVICILHRKHLKSTNSPITITQSEEYEEEDYGTYGLVINRVSTHDNTGLHRTMAEVCGSQLPTDLRGAFGSSVAKHGGPVHMPSIQMVHACVPEQDAHMEIGGTLLSPSLSAAADQDEVEELVGAASGDGNAAVPTEDQRAVYYAGDLVKAAKAVINGQLDRDDVSFFFGASVWSEGQLEDEIEKGWWLPCRAPAEILVSGVCEHEQTESGKTRPEADLWLSMMSACGEEEAKLAHLLLGVSQDDIDGADSHGNPCDYF